MDIQNKKFLKDIGIEKKDFELISKAVKDVEVKTDGEIALAITKQSDDYSIYEILFAISIGFISFLICLLFSTQINNFLNAIFWYPKEWYLPAFIGIIIFITTGIFFLLANISFFDRLIIPKKAKITKVQNRMLIHFLEKGIYKTKHNSGILIFISVMERQVIILGDEGINKKIKSEDWVKICNEIIKGIKNKQTGKALCKAVTSCGKILTEHFPAQKENPNELPDGLVIL